MDCMDCCALGGVSPGPDNSILQSTRRRGSSHPPPAGSFYHTPHVNPYQVLELRRDATETEIVQSYRKLALRHHPGRGRGKEPPEETKRRLVFFRVLSNCYETLMHKESRRRYDVHVKRLERKRLAGLATLHSCNTTSDATSRELVPWCSSAMLSQKSGACRLDTGNGSHHHVLVHHEEREGVPALTSSSSSGGSSAKSHPGRHRHKMEGSSSASSSFKTPVTTPSFRFFCAPRLMQTASAGQDLADSSKTLQTVGQSSTSRSTSAEEPEIHFTEATVNRLFGGPLAPLHQARNFEPFADPFVVFERVFGHPVFPTVTQQDIFEAQQHQGVIATQNKNNQNESQVALCNHKSSGWTGSAHKEPDGLTTVFVSSRIFHDRKITRTETVHVDPETGKAHSEVTVDGEHFEVEPVEKEQGRCGGDLVGWIVCHRGGTTDRSIKEIEPKSPEYGKRKADDYCHNFHCAYGDAMEELYLWNRELYGACTRYMGCTDGAIE